MNPYIMVITLTYSSLRTDQLQKLLTISDIWKILEKLAQLYYIRKVSIFWYLITTFHSRCPSVITQTASVLIASVSKNSVSASVMVMLGATQVPKTNPSSVVEAAVAVSDLFLYVLKIKILQTIYIYNKQNCTIHIEHYF